MFSEFETQPDLFYVLCPQDKKVMYNCLDFKTGN